MVALYTEWTLNAIFCAYQKWFTVIYGNVSTRDGKFLSLNYFIVNYKSITLKRHAILFYMLIIWTQSLLVDTFMV